MARNLRPEPALNVLDRFRPTRKWSRSCLTGSSPPSARSRDTPPLLDGYTLLGAPACRFMHFRFQTRCGHHGPTRSGARMVLTDTKIYIGLSANIIKLFLADK